MGIFTQNMWMCAVRNDIFHDKWLFGIVQPGIHGGIDICVLHIKVSFIVNQPGGIHPVGNFCHFPEITAGGGFISQRPHQNRRMVFVPCNHPYHTGNISGLPGRIIRDPGIISGQFKPMAFQIRLIDQIHAVEVTQIIQIVGIRVMTGTDSVDIKLFHQDNVLFDLFF